MTTPVSLLDECLDIMGCDQDCITRPDEAVLMNRVLSLVREDERLLLVLIIEEMWKIQCGTWRSMSCESCRAYSEVILLLDPTWDEWEMTKEMT